MTKAPCHIKHTLDDVEQTATRSKEKWMIEIDQVKILWDFIIQTDRAFATTKADITQFEKKNALWMWLFPMTVIKRVKNYEVQEIHRPLACVYQNELCSNDYCSRYHGGGVLVSTPPNLKVYIMNIRIKLSIPSLPGQCTYSVKGAVWKCITEKTHNASSQDETKNMLGEEKKKSI